MLKTVGRYNRKASVNKIASKTKVPSCTNFDEIAEGAEQNESSPLYKKPALTPEVSDDGISINLSDLTDSNSIRTSDSGDSKKAKKAKTIKTSPLFLDT